MKTLQQLICEARYQCQWGEFAGDLQVIRDTAFEIGVSLTLRECKDIWQWHSDRHDAQWLNVSAQDVGEVLKAYVTAMAEKSAREVV